MAHSTMMYMSMNSGCKNTAATSSARVSKIMDTAVLVVSIFVLLGCAL